VAAAEPEVALAVAEQLAQVPRVGALEAELLSGPRLPVAAPERRRHKAQGRAAKLVSGRVAANDPGRAAPGRARANNAKKGESDQGNGRKEESVPVRKSSVVSVPAKRKSVVSVPDNAKSVGSAPVSARSVETGRVNVRNVVSGPAKKRIAVREPVSAKNAASALVKVKAEAAAASPSSSLLSSGRASIVSLRGTRRAVLKT